MKCFILGHNDHWEIVGNKIIAHYCDRCGKDLMTWKEKRNLEHKES